MALSVPKSIYPGLKALAQLDATSVERLTEAVRQVPPAGDPDKLASDLSVQLGEPTIPDLLSIIRALVTLHTGRVFNELDVPPFVSQVYDGLAINREFSELPGDAARSLRERLERFLEPGGALAVTPNAVGVVTNHEHKKPRRQMGSDVIVIAPDFNAPLSPEEEELFGLR